MSKPGRPKRAPRARLSLRIPSPIARRLRAYCKKSDEEMSAIAASAIAVYIDFCDAQEHENERASKPYSEFFKESN